MRASGDSMIGAGINSGDMIVIRKQNTAAEGDIVVALVDNESTLKRFFLDTERRWCTVASGESEVPGYLYTELYCSRCCCSCD